MLFASLPPGSGLRCQVNLGRFQAPVYVAQRCMAQWPMRAFLWNAAAWVLGMKGFDRLKAPSKKPSPSAAASSSSSAPSSGPAESEGTTTLKAHMQQTWDESCVNQLDRAAMLYGSVDNMNLQSVLVRCLYPTSEWHSRWVGLGGSVESQGVCSVLVAPLSTR